MDRLFSYGTLQLKKVQKKTFGRILNGKRDILNGYRIKDLKINDKDVIKSSGIDTHPIIYFTGKKNDFIEGTLYEVTKSEITKADNYEVNQYERIRLKFESGHYGWVYVEKLIK